ncbi:MAG TPA: cysteine--tRNA ligase [Chlamydiales bacterium]|nr:cysteine--tRNA ligase [Chlamydiales bacterium]
MKVQLNLFNSETRQKEPITSFDGKIRMYTCGPTIYNFAHIGNFRTYVFEDLLRRSLKFFGFQIEQAMNITDLEDKTIKGAMEQNISLKNFTEPFRIAFFEDLKTLSIEPVEYYPVATDYIPEMIRLIEILLKKGFAYKSANGSIYYKISQFSSYGRLSHLSIDALKVNASGENEADEYDKEHIFDFALWKAYNKERDGKIYWDSPFGPGRPGWHIECSAMAMKILGETIDIHCGGVDNMFPHHENEIAQSESCTGRHFVRHWVHVEHLLVDHKKMSKSSGNFYTLRDLLKRGYTGSQIRFLLLSVHYRTQLNFTFDGLAAAGASLQRIWDVLLRLQSIQNLKTTGLIAAPLHKADLRFKMALADDLNISSALAALFDLIRELNILCDEDKIGIDDAQEVLDCFEKYNQVLGLDLFFEKELPEELLQMLAQREEARKQKDFALSDAIRDAIRKRGYLIEDTPRGARLKKQ